MPRMVAGRGAGETGAAFLSLRETGSGKRARAAPTLATLSAAALLWVLSPGCQEQPIELALPLAAYRDRMLLEHAEQADVRLAARTAAPRRRAPTIRPAAAQTAPATQPERRSLLTQPAITTQPSPDDLFAEIPDPSEADEIFERRLKALQADATEPRVIDSYRRVVEKAREYLQRLRTPTQVRLTLAECIQRALDNSYAIRVESFNPAISQTQLVEAEAAFDAAFFLDSNYTGRDDPTTSLVTQPMQTDGRRLAGGIRKLLPTGTRVETSLQFGRNDIDFPTRQTQQLDPAYDSRFIVQFTQPLLRGFGLDYNRAQIHIRRADQKIAEERFLQQVRDTLLEVETAYWRLAQARRDVMIQAESVGQYYVTHVNILNRREHDATPVEIENSLARWKSREVQFDAAVRTVRDAEDALKNLLNDPDLKLSQEFEIIPVDRPFVAPLAVDQFAEVRTAVDERSEIRAARLAIEQARIATTVAKNETLPQLDASFSYEVHGLGGSLDNSFDSLTTSRFQSYTVGVSFSYPIGNRAAEARWRGAELREHQAVVALHRVTDGIVQEVNNAVRALVLAYKSVPTQYDSVRSSDRSLRAFQARTPQINPPFLDSELNLVESLNNNRSALLRLVTDYNIAIVALERAKGTLLSYNNVYATDAHSVRR